MGAEKIADFGGETAYMKKVAGMEETADMVGKTAVVAIATADVAKGNQAAKQNHEEALKIADAAEKIGYIEGKEAQVEEKIVVEESGQTAKETAAVTERTAAAEVEETAEMSGYDQIHQRLRVSA